MSEPLIFEMSKPGRKGVSLPECDVPAKPPAELLPAALFASEAPPLPEVAARDVVGHFTRLSRKNFSVDTAFYPLGSCTMKYNPRENDLLASLPGFTEAHPYAPELAEGTLELMAGLSEALAEITGMDAVSLEPAAGAHGELTSLLIIQAYHRARGEKRKVVLIPDSAHGTNPASCTLSGFEVREVKSGPDGLVDLKSLRQALTDDVAAMMITNPNTLGLFEKNIVSIAHELHARGALLYLDGANLNAIMGVARPGDFGVDAMHLNLHKTFSTPHGGGGPGAGPIAVKKHLEPFLPKPVVRRGADGRATLDFDRPQSIGKVRAFYGNVGVLVRAYAYIRSLGAKGIRESAEAAVLNANYLLAKLSRRYPVAGGDRCMHEFVATGKHFLKLGVHTLDIAKRLLDYGIHPPTIYFPLIVREALMIEPTETETKEMLDCFVAAMLAIADEAEKNPELLRDAPVTTEFSRFDEVAAARKPKLRWTAPPPPDKQLQLL